MKNIVSYIMDRCNKFVGFLLICILPIGLTGLLFNAVCLAIEGCELLADTYSDTHYPQPSVERYFFSYDVDSLIYRLEELKTVDLHHEAIWYDNNALFRNSYQLKDEALFYVPVKIDDIQILAQCRINSHGAGSTVELLAIYIQCKSNGKYIGLAVNTYLFYGWQMKRFLMEFEQQFLERIPFNWRNETSWVVKYLNPYTSAPFPIKLFPDIYY